MSLAYTPFWKWDISTSAIDKKCLYTQLICIIWCNSIHIKPTITQLQDHSTPHKFLSVTIRSLPIYIYILQVFYHMVSVRPCGQIWVYQIVDFSRSRCAAAMKTTTDISRKKCPGRPRCPHRTENPFVETHSTVSNFVTLEHCDRVPHCLCFASTSKHLDIFPVCSMFPSLIRKIVWSSLQWCEFGIV